MKCTDNSYYIGFTTNLNNRFKKHKSGYGSKHTKDHHVEEILYHEKFDNRDAALKRETQLKKWSRTKKEALIKGDLGKLHELSRRRS